MVGRDPDALRGAGGRADVRAGPFGVPGDGGGVGAAGDDHLRRGGGRRPPARSPGALPKPGAAGRLRARGTEPCGGDKRGLARPARGRPRGGIGTRLTTSSTATSTRLRPTRTPWGAQLQPHPRRAVGSGESWTLRT